MQNQAGNGSDKEVDRIMSAVWCFQCGLEFHEDVAECVECGVPTTDQPPSVAEEVGSATEEQLAYELHEWSGEGRHVLDRMLTGEDIDHAWQGATLIVREPDEERVDDLVEQAQIATMPTLDADQEKMTYELAEYSDELRMNIATLMGQQGIPHEFDRSGDMVVHEADEDAVDAVFDRLEEGAIGPQFGQGVDGVDPHNVIGDLFLLSGKLRKGAADTKAVSQFREKSELAHQLQLPFGFQSTDWRALLTGFAEMSVLLDPETHGSDEEIAELGSELHNTLRQYV